MGVEALGARQWWRPGVLAQRLQWGGGRLHTGTAPKHLSLLVPSPLPWTLRIFLPALLPSPTAASWWTGSCCHSHIRTKVPFRTSTTASRSVTERTGIKPIILLENGRCSKTLWDRNAGGGAEVRQLEKASLNREGEAMGGGLASRGWGTAGRKHG